jgi:serine/threonine protein kinase
MVERREYLTATPPIQVSRHVHRSSWGRRRNHGGKQKPRLLWSALDFHIKERIGKGHFGNIYVAFYRHRWFKDDADTKSIKEPIRSLDAVALKCFLKDAMLANHKKGGRSIQLLKREVNIHSQ